MMANPRLAAALEKMCLCVYVCASERIGEEFPVENYTRISLYKFSWSLWMMFNDQGRHRENGYEHHHTNSSSPVMSFALSRALLSRTFTNARVTSVRKPAANGLAAHSGAHKASSILQRSIASQARYFSSSRSLATSSAHAKDHSDVRKVTDEEYIAHYLPPELFVTKHQICSFFAFCRNMPGPSVCTSSVIGKNGLLHTYIASYTNNPACRCRLIRQSLRPTPPLVWLAILIALGLVGAALPWSTY